MAFMTDELYHHGIKGQKWGIRHYQNPDGTLTPEGRVRYLASLERGDKALNRNKDRGSGYKKAAVKAAIRAAAVTALGKGVCAEILPGMAFVIPPITAVIPGVMPAVLGVAGAMTVKDLYKAVRQDHDISNSYEAGNVQKKYRQIADKYKI